MPRTITDEAIVLKTYDVGEADRFCVLLTRLHGRLSARATGVRKLSSRRGGSLLSLQCIDVELTERSGGQFFIAGASVQESFAMISGDLHAFGMAEQALEILLKLIHDDEPVTDSYDLLRLFLRACAVRAHPLLLSAFTLRLLSQLGILPSLTLSAVSHRTLDPAAGIVFSHRIGGFCQHTEDVHGRRLPADLYDELLAASQAPLHALPQSSDALVARVNALTAMLLQNQLGETLKAAPVAVCMSSGATPT